MTWVGTYEGLRLSKGGCLFRFAGSLREIWFRGCRTDGGSDVDGGLLVEQRGTVGQRTDLPPLKLRHWPHRHTHTFSV